MNRLLILIISALLVGCASSVSDADRCINCIKHVVYEFDGKAEKPLKNVNVKVVCAKPKFIHGFNYTTIGNYTTNKNGEWYIPKDKVKNCFGTAVYYSKPGYKIVNHTHVDKKGRPTEVKAMARPGRYNIIRLINLNSEVASVAVYPNTMKGLGNTAENISASKYAIKYDFDYAAVYKSMQIAKTAEETNYVKSKYCADIMYLWHLMSNEERTIIESHNFIDIYHHTAKKHYRYIQSWCNAHGIEFNNFNPQ